MRNSTGSLCVHLYWRFELDIEAILKYLSPITVGLVAAFLASKFALVKFKQEKTWGERRESYKEVIEAFEELAHWAEQVRASHCCEPTIGGEAHFDESLRKISKFSATGAFFFSKSFHQIVEESNTKLSKTFFQINEESAPDSYTEQGASEWRFVLANHVRGIIDENLPKLVSIAMDESHKNT
jgi:hypothetical protein